MTKSKVTKSMKIGDIVQKHPQAIPIIMSYGLHCVGCHVAAHETLAQGAKGHGLKDKDVTAMIKDINASLNVKKSSTPIMLTVVAARKIEEVLKQEKKKGQGLRVLATGGCAGLHYDLHFETKKAKDDKVFTSRGIKIFIDKTSLRILNGATIDFIDETSGFKINNPNMRGQGCC